MNKAKIAMAALCALASGLVASAAQDDALLAFSTIGPDKYADGTVVADGEHYALVWVKTGEEFKGFKADGTVVDGQTSRLIGTFPRAKDGHCQETYVEINKDWCELMLRAGTLKLFLLDTRKVGGGVAGSDLTSGVQSYGEVADFGTAGAGTIKSVEAGEFEGAVEVTALPDDVGRPHIKDIRVANGKAVLTVQFTHPSVRYTALEKGGKAVAVEAKAGSVENDIVLEVPVDETKKGATVLAVGRDPLKK